MWFGQNSPYSGMLGGMMGQRQMTPGSGMPPTPMDMQIPQMQRPEMVQGAPPPQPQGQAQPGQQPMSPMQMGMLSQMLAQQTGQPAAPPQPVGSPGQGASRQAGYGDAMQNPGMLAQLLKSLGLG